MARLRISVNTSGSKLGFLSPADLEILSAFVDIFYLTCLRQERATIGAPPSLRNILSDYDVQIEFIEFHNPLQIGAFLRNISHRTACSILNRTVFYQEERDRRQIENQISRQRLVEMTMKNAVKAVDTRKKLIKGGLSEEQATRIMASILHSQQAIVA
ncbi:MAG: hypothetical protein ACLPID_00240 [Beijerinckiaceae bacterium]